MRPVTVQMNVARIQILKHDAKHEWSGKLRAACGNPRLLYIHASIALGDRHMKKSALVIIACVAINMLLGIAWYGVFSQPWMDANLLTMEKIQTAGNAVPGYILSMTVAAVSAVILTLILKRMGIRNWLEGLYTGAGIGLIALLGTIVGNWYSMRPLVVSLVDGGFAFLQYAAFCAVIGAAHATSKQA